MKLSKKEQMLLGILGVLVIGVGYYQFLYKSQVTRIEALEIERAGLQERHDTIMTTLSTLSSRQEQIKVLNSKIIHKSEPFYPQFIDENLIVELDKLFSQYDKLKISYTMGQISVQPVAKVAPTEVVKPESSLKPIVDEYDLYFGTGDSGTTSENQNESNGEATEEGNQQGGTTATTTEQVIVNVNFSGEYLEVKNFIDSLQKNNREIVITNVSMSQNEAYETTGSMTLEFYAVPKISDEVDEYLLWNLDGDYGKATPLSPIGVGAGGNTIEDLAQPTKEENEFVMLVKPINSDLPTLMMGKANDSTRATYIYSDNEGVEDVELIITQANGKYYYKYKNSKSVYPSQYNGNGVEFTPSSDTITLKITSQARLDENDKSGINLKVQNQSDKSLEIVVAGDDTQKPRVNIVAEGNGVKVTKK